MRKLFSKMLKHVILKIKTAGIYAGQIDKYKLEDGIVKSTFKKFETCNPRNEIDDSLLSKNQQRGKHDQLIA